MPKGKTKMKSLNLTPRLMAIAELVSKQTVADIGTDHGKLLIYLAECGRLKKGIGSDIAIGPADACRKNVHTYGFGNIIEIRVGDGLLTISKGEVETIVMAGMGGELILSIIEKSLSIASVADELILQPMTNVRKMLEGISRLGFEVAESSIVKEKDKLYQVFKVKKGKTTPKNQIDFIISPSHLKGNSPNLVELIRREIKKYEEQKKGLLDATVKNEEEIEKISALIKELEEYEIRYNS